MTPAVHKIQNPPWQQPQSGEAILHGWRLNACSCRHRRLSFQQGGEQGCRSHPLATLGPRRQETPVNVGSGILTASWQVHRAPCRGTLPQLLMTDTHPSARLQPSSRAERVCKMFKPPSPLGFANVMSANDCKTIGIPFSQQGFHAMPSFAQCRFGYQGEPYAQGSGFGQITLL